MKSSKKYISEYIILKILKDQYTEGEVIPSENKLAIKFKCSRLTSRSSLITLVNFGILNSFKGRGYEVSEHAMSLLFYVKKLKQLSSKTLCEEIKSLDIIIPRKTLEKDEVRIFKIENYDSLNNITSLSFMILNVVKFSNFASLNIEKNILDTIFDYGFIPASINVKFLIGQIKEYEDIISKLECHPHATPILEQTLFDDQGNAIIKTYSVSKKDTVLFECQKKFHLG